MWLIRRKKGECQTARGMLSAYIDQRLSSGEQKRVEHHLVSCPACRSELDSLRATVGLLHRVPLVSPPRSFALAEAKPASRRIPVGALRTATAVATALLLIFFAGDMLHFFESTVTVPPPEVSQEEEGLPPQVRQDGEGQLPLPPLAEEYYQAYAQSSGLPTSSGGEMADQWAQQENAEEGLTEQEGPTEEKREFGWLLPLEFALLGTAIMLGGITTVSWRKRRKVEGGKGR